ncbi:MAG TPA: DegT/DnrJ/EryC1/StrS family aminotransferase [Allosphingosinicella sp.]|jgi:dTDP-4-amino-4,6-dideoxygalactose transaminase|nr:DegT/DnrJ/EryC1/StrS family aminotransferase [Allosphingosinicella sp.]
MLNVKDMGGAPPAAADLRQGPDEHWPFYAEDEVEAVARVLRSGRVNQWTGPEVFAFQDALARTFGGEHCIALANGSLALELPLRAFGIGPGDEVVVTPRTFVASATCVMLLGATPVFADIDPDSGNITAESIEAVLTERTRAIIPVHIAGWPCDMPAIMALAERRGLLVIEDCAQSHGAEIDGRPAGSFGQAAALSFCQDKIITTGGEGGAVLFKDEDAWDRAWSFKDHGKNRRKVEAPQTRPGFRWLHDGVGTNWRLTGPQAAIGLRQLEKLDEWHALRTRNAGIWAEALANLPGLRVPLPDERFRHAFYRLNFYMRPGAEDARDEILARAAEAGLRLFTGSCSEVYLEEAFRDLPRPDLPNARAMTKSSLAVETHPTLKPDRVRLRAEKLAGIVRSVLG